MWHILVSHNSSICSEAPVWRTNRIPTALQSVPLPRPPFTSGRSSHSFGLGRAMRRPACQKTSFPTWPAGQNGGVDPVGGPGIMIEALKKLCFLRRIYIHLSATWTCVLHTSHTKKRLCFVERGLCFIQGCLIYAKSHDSYWFGKQNSECWTKIYLKPLKHVFM